MPAPSGQPVSSAHARSASAALRPGAPRRDACLIVSPRGVPAPAVLLESLARRPVEVLLRDDPLSAMAAACLMHRESAPSKPGEAGGEGASEGGGEGGGPGGAMARGVSSRANLLIFCEPQRVQDVGELVEMLRRYAPRVALWWFSARESPNLRAVTNEDVAGWTIAEGLPTPVGLSPLTGAGAAPADDPAPVTPALMSRTSVNPSSPRPPTNTGGPNLRLVDAPDDEGAGDARPGTIAGAARTPPTLTPDELAMLLGDDHPPRGAAS